jgi:hypothetical protein
MTQRSPARASLLGRLSDTGRRGKRILRAGRWQKITLAEMRAAGVRGLLICCDQLEHGVQLSDFEPGFVCTTCP